MQAVHDVIVLQRVLSQHRPLTKAELEDYASAVPWLKGKRTPGLSLRIVAEATNIDVRRLYTAPYEDVVREMRLRKSGRRKREDYV